MERLRVPINSFFFGEKMSSECIEQSPALNMSYPHVSFLQMLSGVNRSEEEQDEEAEEGKKELRFQIHQRLHRESNLQRLLEIQSLYSNTRPMANAEPFPPPAEPQLGSCVTRTPGPSNVGPRERRKRKKSRAPPLAAARNPQEAENQRMNHIAVERNRRRLMNSHLNTLRSLMPQSFVQRVDQASVVAGAIDFVKELEQLLLSLQAQKRMRADGDATATATSSSSASSSCTNELEEGGCHAAAATTAGGFFISPQYTGYRVSGAHGSGGVDVEATVVQGHVNLKVLVRRRRGQLARAVAAVEEIGLSVLHLNITSLDACSVLYSLNLKIEEGCKLGSADEIATAVNQIFGYISACCDSY